MMERNLSVELRPETLDEFIGCESITNPIKEGLKQGRVDSTYLFFGPPGCGKTSMARALFKHICGKQQDYDVTEPDTADLGADEIRELIGRARLNPWVGKYKGIILDEAHKLSAPTQTILLKALEEPCSSTVWFVCSSEPGKLSEAIRRRGSNNVLPALNDTQTEDLIKCSLKKISGKIEKDYFPRYQELLVALIRQEVTSPGFIIRALEKFITGVPADQAAQVLETTTVDTFAIAKGAAAGNWEGVKKLLSLAPASAAKDIRRAVSLYFKGILVRESSGSVRAERCVWAIEKMAELANQSQFEDGLIMAATCAGVYKICLGQKEFKAKKGM